MGEGNSLVLKTYRNQQGLSCVKSTAYNLQWNLSTLAGHEADVAVMIGWSTARHSACYAG